MSTRILVLSDIHANLTALQAVLNHAGPVDAVWSLGDVVGYGPDPNECIALLKAQPNLVCLLGNHDAAALGQIDMQTFNREARLSVRWMQSILTAESTEFLNTLPEKQVVGDATLAHGSPRNPVWEYLLDIYTASLNLEYFDTSICMVGHTHIPAGYFFAPNQGTLRWRVLKSGDTMEMSGRAIINPGSVGQPRDHDARAAYAIFDPEAHTWTAQRVAYNIIEVQERIERAGLPIRHAERLTDGS